MSTQHSDLQAHIISQESLVKITGGKKKKTTKKNIISGLNGLFHGLV